MVTNAPFALAPALVSNDILDYSTAHGTKMYHEAIHRLSDDKFDLTAEGLISFLSKLKAKALINGWMDVLDIPSDATAPNDNLSSLTESYGEITLETIEQHTQTYISTRSRAAQDSSQLYFCLLNSLSEAGLAKATIWEDQYTVR